MVRGYAHAIIATPNLHDPLVQLLTIGVLHSWRSPSIIYLPAHNERDNEELITHVV